MTVAAVGIERKERANRKSGRLRNQCMTLTHVLTQKLACFAADFLVHRRWQLSFDADLRV